MKKRMLLTLVSSLLTFVPIHASDDTASSKAPITFEKQIRPILKAYCFECHGEGERLRGSLDLRLKRLAEEGGDSGPALIPGNTDKSLLFQRVSKKEMPPGKVKLEKEHIALIEHWITQGAKTAGPEPKEIGKGVYVTPEERAFWSFQPIANPAVPKVKHQQLAANPIDAFLLRKLEDKKLSFSPEADRVTLIRRVYFDLIGLPPSPNEVADFAAEQSPKAYEKLIDRLLASPQYGERWGRHWLDVAGYADSEGFSNEDPVRKQAYKYRDYVIRSFNEDKPMDQFIREQLAGDEMVPYPYQSLTAEQKDKLIATGFLRMAADGTASKGMNKPEVRDKVIVDTIHIVSSSLLGMTVQCAQCHNHKYDPISQKDYYSLRAILEPGFDWKQWKTPAARQVVLFSAEEKKKAAEIEKQAKAIDQVRLKKQAEYIERTLEKQIAKLPKDVQELARKAKAAPVKKQTAEQKKILKKYPSLNVTAGSLYLYDRKAANELKEYAAKAAKLRDTKPSPKYIRAFTETAGKVPPTHLFKRGDFSQPDVPVIPAGLTILQEHKLSAIPENDKKLPTSGRRLAFAKRLTSGKHPLTARVLVNRVWMHHFGRGIVNSPDDFGQLGDRPTHPELLDWLASEFMNGGWKLKRFHKLIMMSTAYRQSSIQTSELHKVDPDNRLLGRMSLRRLEAEIVRDAILAVTGKLNRKQFGPPVPVKIDQFGQIVIGVDTRDGAGRFTGKVIKIGDEEYRRSVYVQTRRSEPLAVLETFDAPNMSPNCVVRNNSTVAQQSLMLMNSNFIHTQAKFFAQRLQKESGNELPKQVTLAWQLAYGKRPLEDELKSAVDFVNGQTAVFAGKKKTTTAAAREMALTNFCQALLSSNAFLYVD